jgi:hypothetical protein
MMTRISLLSAGVAAAAALAAGGVAFADAAAAPTSSPSPQASAGRGAGASPSQTGRAAPAVNPCAMLDAARAAAAEAKATTAIKKSNYALGRARAEGCPNQAATKQTSTGADMTALARSLGVSEAKLDQALREVKQAGTTNLDEQAAVFAGALGVDKGRAKAALQQLMAVAHPAPEARVLATRLGIAIDRAQWALARIRELDDKPGGVRVTDPDFVALAHQLGVTASQLGSALDAAERSANADAQTPSPSPAVPATGRSPSATLTR